MTPTELRVEALRLAVATPGHSQKVMLAQDYLSFLTVVEEASRTVIVEKKTGTKPR